MNPVPAVSVPAPTKLRLLRVGASASKAPAGRVKPPLGLSAWSTDETADVVIVLERPLGHEIPTLDEVTAQVAAPDTLPPGTLVVVLGDLEPSAALLGRWLGGKPVAPRALRSSALLALGYERLGGAVDPKSGHDLAWGYVPARDS